MPKTIIKIKTWTCSHCKSQRDSNPFDPNIKIGHEDVPIGKCHFCFKGLLEDAPGVKKDCTGQQCEWQPETDKTRLCTMTIMGEEDIELEILDRDESKHRIARLAEIDTLIARMDDEGEFATSKKRELQRERLKESIEREIIKKKESGYFLDTPAKVNDYRTKREKDIKEAIIKAKLLEDI